MTTDGPTTTTRSRRDRPAKPALTRAGIVEAALVILREDGLSKVTMRRIAAALDTGAASLYVYVRDTEDLHAQILDALLGEITPPERARGTWRDQLKAMLTQYTLVLFAYPEIARMAMSTQPSGPNYLALVDAILGLLHEGDVPDREAAWAVDLLLLFATATAAEQSTRSDDWRVADDISALAGAIGRANAGDYPHIARLGNELLSGGPVRSQWGFDVLLSGILATRRPDADVEPDGGPEMGPDGSG